MEHRVSYTQLEEMLEFLSSHQSLVKGIGLGARSKENMDRMWNTLASKLNAHGSGATKDGARWKRYWIDLKHRVKAGTGTGGGPPSQDDLSEIDKKNLALIGVGAVHGDTEHRVPAFRTQSEPSTTISCPVSAFPEPEQEVLADDAEFAQTQDTVLVVVNSPSSRGHTSSVYVQPIRQTTPNRTQTSPSLLHDTPVSRPRTSARAGLQTKSPAFRPRSSARGGQRTNRNRIEPAWLIELEKRRVAAEEKLAEASMIIAQAAQSQVESTKCLIEIIKHLINKND